MNIIVLLAGLVGLWLGTNLTIRGATAIATRFGMAATLALIPVLMVGGWLIVAAIPLLESIGQEKMVLYGPAVARSDGDQRWQKDGLQYRIELARGESGRGGHVVRGAE